MMGEEEISCEFCLQSSIAIKQMVSFFLFGYSPSICNLVCNSKKVGSFLAHFIRCLKNSGCFWSANEKRLSPLWYINTWLCSRGGDEAAWLSCSDIILMSVVARKFLTVTTFCLKSFCSSVSPQQWSHPSRSLLAFWLALFFMSGTLQVVFLLPEVHWIKQFSLSLQKTEWNHSDAD